MIYRLPLLKARNELDSWLSREAAFMVNNWILLFAALFVLFGTMFPTLSEAVTGERLTVAGAVLQQVDDAGRPGDAGAHRRRAAARVAAARRSRTSRDSSCGPAARVCVAGSVAMAASGFRSGRLASASRCAASSSAPIVQEFWRGASVRRRNTGTDFLTAMIGLVGRNKRRYGGYIVHVGIVLIFFGFAGNARKLDEQVNLKPGQEAKIGSYTIRNTGVKVSDDGQKQMTTAYLAVFVGGKQIDGLYPARWAYRRHEQEPTTEVAIRRTPAEDLYAVLGGFDLADQSATLQLVVNPLVNWIWVGFGVMALGTGIALLPERSLAFAMAKMPAEAATTDRRAAAAVRARRGASGVGAAGDGRPGRHARRRSTRARRSRSRCSTRSSAPAARAATRRSPSAARTTAARRTRCAASWRR